MEQNPSLKINLMDILKTSDPSDTNKYLDFLLKQIKGKFKLDASVEMALSKLIFGEENIKLLFRFEDHIKNNRIKSKDISTYKTFEDIKKEVKIADEEVTRKELESQMIKLFEDDDVLICIPQTYENCKIYGMNTKWCITQLTHWNSYQWNYRIIFVIFKKTNVKFAISKRHSNSEVLVWDAEDKSSSLFSNANLVRLMPHYAECLADEQYVTELKYLGPNEICLTSGLKLDLSKVNKSELNEFLNKFGPTLKRIDNEKYKKLLNDNSKTTSKNEDESFKETLDIIKKYFSQSDIVRNINRNTDLYSDFGDIFGNTTYYSG